MTMKTELLSPSDYHVMPWKNGLGKTTEIAIEQNSNNPERYLWRVSIADVTTDGPFSHFNGYQRLIATIEGAGMELTVDGTAHVVRHRDPAFAFSGEAEVDCRLLDGPIRDFNLIYDPELVAGDVELLSHGEERQLQAKPSATVFIHALDSIVHVDGFGMVKSNHTLKLEELDQQVRVRCAENAAAVIVTVTPKAV